MPKGERDVARQSEEERRHLAVTVGRFLLHESDEDDRREAIENLAHLLSHDACVAVRKALAEEVKACEFLPRDIAERIARDVDDVSVPFIEESPVLSEAFLLDLVEECSDVVRGAVASRPGLSENLGYAITEYGGDHSIGRLLGNAAAAVSDRICLNICDKHEDDAGLMQQMAKRSDLTLIVVDRLVSHLSAQACERLVTSYGLAIDYASYLQSQTRRRALRSTFASASDTEVAAYISRLQRMNDLGPDVLLHFLDQGEIRFFRTALAVKAGVPEGNVELLLEEGGAVGLERLLEKCGLKGAVLRLIRVSYYECLGKICKTSTSRAAHS